MGNFIHFSKYLFEYLFFRNNKQKKWNFKQILYLLSLNRLEIHHFKSTKKKMKESEKKFVSGLQYTYTCHEIQTEIEKALNNCMIRCVFHFICFKHFIHRCLLQRFRHTSAPVQTDCTQKRNKTKMNRWDYEKRDTCLKIRRMQKLRFK